MEVIDQIKQTANIVDIASQYTNLIKRGKSHVGLCPFHSEKTPSFTLDLDRQLFPFATPSEIVDHIGETHATLSSPQGGLILYAECEPDVPMENIEAICSALEKICTIPDLSE